MTVTRRRRRQQEGLSENHKSDDDHSKGPIDIDDQLNIIQELQRQSIQQTNRAATILSVVSFGAAIASFLCREQSSQIQHHHNTSSSSFIPSINIISSSILHLLATSIAHGCKNLWKNHTTIISLSNNNNDDTTINNSRILFQKLGWKEIFGIMGISLYLIVILFNFNNTTQDVSSDDDDDYLYMRLFLFNSLTMTGGIILRTDTIHTIREWISLESSKYNYKSL